MNGRLAVQSKRECIPASIESFPLIESVCTGALEVARQTDRIATLGKRLLLCESNQRVSVPAAPARFVHDQVINEQGPAGSEVMYQAPADQTDRPLVLLQDKQPISLTSAGAQTLQILILGELLP